MKPHGPYDPLAYSEHLVMEVLRELRFARARLDEDLPLVPAEEPAKQTTSEALPPNVVRFPGP